ncbi:MAG: hypothetical protein GTO71_07740 [Woeseiaceae bacterium]|nr:hypothetical protein [Woeseiaceae bacterium]NIP20980.1 hypothetical protein [Woeseiaceae bacterium]NIS89960.1 hypothetical protein [Woeseiaceae bacterium]
MLMKTPLLAIGSVMIAAILAGAAPFLFEYGAKNTQGKIVAFITSPYIIAGMMTYVTVMVFFTYAFRLGGTVRVLYPIYATMFIWAAIIAWLLHGDPIRPVHVLGMGLLLTGIVLMTA